LERNRQLDAACPAPRFRLLIAAVLLLGSSVFAQTLSGSQDALTSRLELLSKEGDWQEIVALASPITAPSADVEYYYGLALAQLRNLDQAQKIFTDGQKSYPRDKRFPMELGGIQFKEKHYEEAGQWMRCALRIDATDAYANDFLGTTYFLQGNLDAALKYWNRTQKPQIASILLTSQPGVSPALLDRLFVFAPASTLKLDELWSSEARIQGTGIFSSYSFEMAPKTQESFDLRFNSAERHGLGDTKLETALSLFRGLFRQTIYPEYFNFSGSTTNLLSLLRWDAQRRRFFAALSGPIRHDPKWRYEVNADLRNENWQMRDSPATRGIVVGAFNFRREAIGASVKSIPNWRWQWTSGVEVSHRDFRGVVPGDAVTPGSTPAGFSVKQFATVNYEFLRAPEDRLSAFSDLREETGRVLTGAQDPFSKLQASVGLRWLPRPRGDDLETKARLNFARSFGQLPFDELFMLGLDPDNLLMLRAHVAARDGIKGNAPIGRNFLLANFETNKIVYSNGLLTLKVGPFVDLGKIIDAGYTYEEDKLLIDAGVQATISVLGVGFTLSYGKDLRSGANAVYAAAR